MNEKDVEYLDMMDTESEKRILKKDEFSRIRNILHNNIDADDLVLCVSIVDNTTEEVYDRLGIQKDDLDAGILDSYTMYQKDEADRLISDLQPREIEVVHNANDILYHLSGIASHQDRLGANKEEVEKLKKSVKWLEGVLNPEFMEDKAISESTNKDPLDKKLEMLRCRLGDKVGKTADVKTGKVTDEHRETARVQVEISKAFIKPKREKESKSN